MIIDHDENSYTAKCDSCGDTWIFEDYEVELMPWPHLTCPHCGHWIPLF